MKAEVQLCTALKDLLDEIPYGIPIKDQLSIRVAHLVAALQVFTDLNFTEKEQEALFAVAGVRIAALRKVT